MRFLRVPSAFTFQTKDEKKGCKDYFISPLANIYIVNIDSLSVI